MSVILKNINAKHFDKLFEMLHLFDDEIKQIEQLKLEVSPSDVEKIEKKFSKVKICEVSTDSNVPNNNNNTNNNNYNNNLGSFG